MKHECGYIFTRYSLGQRPNNKNNSLFAVFFSFFHTSNHLSLSSPAELLPVVPPHLPFLPLRHSTSRRSSIFHLAQVWWHLHRPRHGLFETTRFHESPKFHCTPHLPRRHLKRCDGRTSRRCLHLSCHHTFVELESLAVYSICSGDVLNWADVLNSAVRIVVA